MPADWAARYVGIPWLDGGRDRTGCDCWGLTRLVYGEVFGIDLPSHRPEYGSAADRAEVAKLLNAQLTEPASPWKPVRASRVGDALLFRVAGASCHVGVYLGDHRFLHVRPDADACVERLTSPIWARRCIGAYRHEALE